MMHGQLGMLPRSPAGGRVGLPDDGRLSAASAALEQQVGKALQVEARRLRNEVAAAARNVLATTRRSP
jgi:hypothetical protein